MGKRGIKPIGKIKIKWSRNFAYAIGLIVTDGNLSKDGSRITFVSKDIEQIENFSKCLGIKVKIGINKSGSTLRTTYRLQFRDVLFFNFLNSIGIYPNKSKIIKKVKIPQIYFFDFLRGYFDGDGTVYSYWDKRWKSSFMFYVVFISASFPHIEFLREEIYKNIGIKGHITSSIKSSCKQLKYAKKESLILLKKMYYSNDVICLTRKKLKINNILAIVRK
jgi:hypothetical protein